MRDDKIHKILSETPKPGVREGHHKTLLKQQMMEGFAAPEKKEVRKSMKLGTIFVFAALVVIIVATAAWAIQKYKRVEVYAERDGNILKTHVTDETGETKEYELEIDPDAKGPVMVTIGPDGNPTISNQLPPEIQDAFDNGNYTVTEIQEECNGKITTLYHYKFDLGEDKQMELKVPYRLEELDESDTEE